MSKQLEGLVKKLRNAQKDAQLYVRYTNKQNGELWVKSCCVELYMLSLSQGKRNFTAHSLAISKSIVCEPLRICYISKSTFGS